MGHRGGKEWYLAGPDHIFDRLSNPKATGGSEVNASAYREGVVPKPRGPEYFESIRASHPEQEPIVIRFKRNSTEASLLCSADWASRYRFLAYQRTSLSILIRGT